MLDNHDPNILDDGQAAFVVEFCSHDENGHAWHRGTVYIHTYEEQCYYCGAHREIEKGTDKVLCEW